MVAKRDYYDVLGVSRNADSDDIRKAFRRLARQFHPDVSKEDNAEARFKEVNEANEILSDPDKRRLYDQFGHNMPGAGGPGTGAAGFGGIEEIFETFFGGSQRAGGGRRRARGADLRYDLQLEFLEAVFGTSRELEIPRLVHCERCSGNGSEPGKQPQKCTSCNGSGETRRVAQSVFGQFVNVTPCDRCRGRGQIITSPCTECRGRGEVQSVRKIPITIPAGVDEGQHMQVNGEGEAGANGGPAGDLYVVLSVKEHPVFKRERSDVIVEVTVNVAQAALGDEVEVPTIDGFAKLKVPAGFRNGHTLRMRDKGIPHLRGKGRGDQQVRVEIQVPTKLTEQQRRLFEDLAVTFNPAPKENDESKTNQEKHGKGVVDRIKDLLGGE